MSDADAAVTRLLDALHAAPPRLGAGRLLAIDGPSGSGKSTLVEAVLRRRPDASVLRIDELYEGWDGLPDVGSRVEEALADLAGGRVARPRAWDWHADAWGEPLEIAPAPVVLLEGVGAGDRRHAPLTSLLVWCEAPAPVRHARGVARDGEAMRPHLERWWRAEDAHHAAEDTRARADLVVVTGGPEHPGAGPSTGRPSPPRVSP